MNWYARNSEKKLYENELQNVLEYTNEWENLKNKNSILKKIISRIDTRAAIEFVLFLLFKIFGGDIYHFTIHE